MTPLVFFEAAKIGREYSKKINFNVNISDPGKATSWGLTIASDPKVRKQIMNERKRTNIRGAVHMSKQVRSSRSLLTSYLEGGVASSKKIQTMFKNNDVEGFKREAINASKIYNDLANKYSNNEPMTKSDAYTSGKVYAYLYAD